MTEEAFSQQARDYELVEQAIRFLEANFRRQPSLDEIAASVHLSKYHFQRLFRRWAGISPSQFLHFLTVEYAKRRLEAAQSVLDTALDAGLSGPGRLHDLFVTQEAISPGEYKQQGIGLQIAYGLHDSPFGRCLLATTVRGICALYFVPDGDEIEVLAALTHRWPKATFADDPRQTRPAVERIFAPVPPDQAQPFHLLLRGTNFQIKVWQGLLSIPPGAMVSYQDVAAYLGQPKATRAVAHAIAQNPVAYLIPCHRVISRAGQAHRYRWGTARKKAMLGWEASRGLTA